ncbi:hypothetical protein LPJ61_003817 [Coemansia biformis]|uniref:OPT superfamily oligopeptide transporter n=1 Tax=Coemansia biformis TaxID=1286918 RepID=A0A9W8CXV9_9FUNG|nr:hypothetical protein LPJ61_003817 [Coemansia biformis]
MLLGVATFVYQIIISYIVPILKSLCLLCLWAPQSKLASLLGSGWNGTGILSLTFDWEALGTLQPLITPLWAQCQYYAGALLMTYVLTPIGWHLDWWGSQSLPIVSTNVFDTMGNAYNISLVHKFRNPDIDLSVHRLATYAPGLFKYKAYSPVRLTAVTGFTLPMDLIPHMFGGVMQGPGTPIETSYFHLWATVPIRVALGWTGVQRDTSIEDLPNPDILLVSSFDMSEFNSQELEDYLDNDGESLFSAESPYRMLFVYGALLGALLPPLFFLAHHVFERLARMASERNSTARGWWGLLARAAKAVQVPLVLTGMVAVPTMPANFVLSGLAIAVGGQLWLRSRNKSLVDLSLYSAVLYLGTQMAIVGMFIVGEILTAEHVPLSFVRWWGNQLENVEHCADV